MKKIKYVLKLSLVIFLMLLLTGCTVNVSFNDDLENEVSNIETESKNEVKEENNDKAKDIKDLYFQVLNNELPLQIVSYYDNEVSEEMKLYDWNKDSETGEVLYKNMSYAFCDIDNTDDDIEMVILFTDYDGAYIVVNYENEKMIGYEYVVRGLESLKTDGRYYGSGGAATGAILRSTYNNKVKEEETIASRDWEEFEVAGKKATEAEFNKVFEEFQSVDDVEFIDYKTFE